MTTHHLDFLTTMWIPEEIYFVNCYSYWDEFVAKAGQLPDRFVLGDHMFGFRPDGSNRVLDVLQQHSRDTGRTWTVVNDQIFPKRVHDRYPDIKLEFNLGLFERYGSPIRMPPVHEYPQHPDIDFRNFLCSFNGSFSLSRKLLPSALKKFGWYDTDYVSKHSTWDPVMLDGALMDLVGEEEVLYRKFFDTTPEFAQSINGFGYNRGKHDANIYNLEHRLTQSFVHVVSETVATSSVPFVTEKAFYSVITRGLFVSYAPPGWYQYWTDIFGLRRYDRLFDHGFDTIENPIKRLVAMLCMLSKYSNLSTLDWHDLYQLEADTIEFNYEHFRSGDYVRSLDKYSQEHLYY